MDPPASHRVSVSRGTHEPIDRACSFVYRAITCSGRPFQWRSTSSGLGNCHLMGRTTPMRRNASVWAAPRSLATTRGILSFRRGTEMFQFPRCPRSGLCVHPAVTRVGLAGLPHSDIQGSSRAGRSPWRFAANRVLLRRLAPRHPPCALLRLTVLFAT